MNSKLIQRSFLVSALIVLIVLNFRMVAQIFAQSQSSRQAPVAASAFESLELFTRTMELIHRNYLGESEPGYDVLIKHAIKGMLSSLDRHSQFLEPEEYESMKDDAKGSFGGLGIVISAETEHLAVLSVRENTPAAQANIAAGDLILEIDSEKTAGMNIQDAVEKLRGEVDTRVTLLIQRDDSDSFKVELVRSVIDVKSVMGLHMLEDGITYLRLTRFSQSTGKELRNRLAESLDDGMSGLIVDLRDNPGGLLPAAVSVADIFLDEGALIVSTRSRDEKEDEYHAETHAAIPRSIPMAVLINEGSASASEIVAGALKDHRRAILIGERSFGKGSVQSVFSINEGSAIRLTTAKYYTPSENLIEEHGIEPDIKIEIHPQQWARIRVTHRNEDLAGATEEMPIADSPDEQLKMAVYILRGSKIIGEGGSH